MKVQFSVVMGFILLLGFGISHAQQESKPRPKKILGIAKENKPISYYQQQSELWQDLIEKERDNAEAWHHYYKAERAKLQLEDPNLWANDRDTFYKKLAPILNGARKHIGSKFEYFYLIGLNSEGQTSIDALKKAYSIDPERSEAYGWLFSYYVPRFKETESIDFAERMLQSNIYSDANLKWNYNALVSVEQDGIIISNGDMDGIPKWVLQYGAQVRPDVLVTNKWLLATDEDYRKKVYSDIGISLPELTASDFDDLTLYADYLAADILKRSKRPTYISSGTPLQFFKDNGLEGKMYLVGNALKYSEENFDNTAVMIENFEEKYYLEYLFKNFQQHREDEVVKTRMNLTYLPGLIHLMNHYKSINQNIKVQYFNSLINIIATDSGRKDEVLKWFNQ